MKLFGRREILTDYTSINAENVKDAVNKAMTVHIQNKTEIDYLFKYFRGGQPICDRCKTVRPDIVHNTVVNRASEIVTFKVSYLLGAPVVYVSRSKGAKLTGRINKLNDYMYLAGKHASDKRLADDFSICGVAYRFVYPNEDKNGVPFILRTLDPMNTFVAYENAPYRDSEPVFSVTYVNKKGKDGRKRNIYDVYTDDSHFTIDGNTVEEEKNLIGSNPIIEYVNNEFRLGAFEQVIDLMNAANVLESNRIEATEQNVQSLMWFNDITLTDEQQTKLKSQPSAFVFTKTVPNASTPSIKAVAVDLQQADQQVLANDIYKDILTIVGMPSTGDGNTSDSSNNGSTIVRNGWYHAEARAKDTATLWEYSDKRFLNAALRICKKLGDLDLNSEDVVGKFTRRNYEDIGTKATVLTTLLANDKVHPQIAYQVSDITPDAEDAYTRGMEWYNEQKDKETGGNRDEAGQGDSGSNRSDSE